MNELAVVNTSLIDSVNLDEIQAVMKKINTFQAIVKNNLRDGHDFGTIPGTPKPTLYKPGGEKICMMFGVNPDYEIMTSTADYKGEFFSYDFKCTLFKNGSPCAQGVGSCNSKEKKYRYINVSEIPDGYVGPSEQITTSWGEIKYKIENNDTCSLVNTIMKMAKKRAFIDAVLQVASLSEIFTQDLEDMQDFASQEQKAAAGTMTSEQAGRVKVNFGKFKGKTLGEIFREDLEYFQWLSENAKQQNIKTACGIMLAAVKAVSEEKKKQKAQSVPDNEPTAIEDPAPDNLPNDFFQDDMPVPGDELLPWENTENQ